MKLIFGKKGEDGIVELQRYFSHIPGTINFGEMTADLHVAQEELFKFTGKELVKRAVLHYHSKDFKYPGMFDSEPESSGSGSGGDGISLNDRLVYRVQMAVALTGYREYALNNDATHTKTGRMARMDKERDELSEKLIDRDDFALQRKGQTAIDRLITFADENKLPEWTDSEIIRETKELLVWNATEFHRFHPIEYSRRLYLLLVPMIRSVQQDFIEPLFQKEMWEELKKFALNPNKTDGTEVAGSEDEEKRKQLKLLYDKTGYAIAYLAMSAGYKDLPAQLFPESMSRQFWSAGSGQAFVRLREVIIADLYNEGLRKLSVLEFYVRSLEAEAENREITDDEITSIADRMSQVNKFVRV